MIRGELNAEQRAAALEFISLYGERWKTEMLRFHDGKPSHKGMHILHLIRQIRNNVTGEPDELERLLGLDATPPITW